MAPLGPADLAFPAPAQWPHTRVFLDPGSAQEQACAIIRRTVSPEAQAYFQRILRVTHSELEKLLIHKVTNLFDPLGAEGPCRATPKGEQGNLLQEKCRLLKEKSSAEGQQLTAYVCTVLSRIMVDFSHFADLVLRWERAEPGAESSEASGPDTEQVHPSGLLLERLERQDQQNTELEVKYSNLQAELREKNRQFLRDRSLFRERLRLLRAYALAAEDAELLQLLQHDVQFYHEEKGQTVEDVKEEYEKKLSAQEMAWKEVVKEKDYEIQAIQEDMARIQEANDELKQRRMSDRSGALQKKLDKAESVLEETEAELRQSQEEARKWKSEHGGLQKELVAWRAAHDECEAELQEQKTSAQHLREKLESLQSGLSAAEAAARRAEAAEQRLQKELQAKKAKPRLVKEVMTHLSIQPDGRLERAEQEGLRLAAEVTGLTAELEEARVEAASLQEAVRVRERDAFERQQEVEELTAQLHDAKRSRELEARTSQEAVRQLENKLQALQAKLEAQMRQAADSAAELERLEATRNEAESQARTAQEAEASEVHALRAALAEAQAAQEARARTLVSQFQQTESWAAENQEEEIQRLRKEVQTWRDREAELLKQLDERLSQNSIASEDKQCQTDLLEKALSVRDATGQEPSAQLETPKIGKNAVHQASTSPWADPDSTDVSDMVAYPRVLSMGGGWLQGVSLSSWRGKLRQQSKQTQTSRSPSASPPGSKTPKERKERTRSPDRERHMPIELTAEGLSHLSRGRSPQPFPSAHAGNAAKVLLPLTAKAKRSTVCRSPPRLRVNSKEAMEAAETRPAQTRLSRSPEAREAQERPVNRVPAEVERRRKAPAHTASPQKSAAGHPLGGPELDSVGPLGAESQVSWETTVFGSGPSGLQRSSDAECGSSTLASIDMSRAAVRQSADAARTNTSRAAKDTGTMRRSGSGAASSEATPCAAHGVLRPRSAAQLPSVRRMARSSGNLGTFRPCSAATLQRPAS